MYACKLSIFIIQPQNFKLFLQHCPNSTLSQHYLNSQTEPKILGLLYQEMGEVVRSLGHTTKQKEIEEMLRQLDGDGSGSVDFPEFLNIIAIKMCEDDSNDELRQAFNVFDEDGDGFIRYIQE